MLLVIDIGNTDIVFGFYAENTWKAILRTPTHQPWSPLRLQMWLVKELKEKGFDIGKTDSVVTPVYMKGGVEEATLMVMDLRENYKIDDDDFVSPKDTQFSMNYDQVTPYHGVVLKHLLEKIEQLEQEVQLLKQQVNK